MKLALTMPQFGESITEALIVRWLKREGEEVSEKEPLIEMETEKSVFSYESPFKGKLIRVVEGESRQVKVGTEIAHFEIQDDLAKKYLSLGIGRSLEGEKKQESIPSLSPLIRSLAKEHGVSSDELAKIPATGPEGRLTKEDFLKFVGSRQAPQSSEGIKIINLSPIRLRIAEKMMLSKREIPHAGTGVDVDVTSIEEWRHKNQSKAGYLPFVILSLHPALRKYPVLNSSLKAKDGGQWLEEYSYLHLGIATATEQGLLVPVLKNAQQKSFVELVDEMSRLVEKGRGGKLDLAELTGATFTLNNTGALGAFRSQQIIPHPQTGILAINRVVKRPWVVKDQITIRSILSLDLAFDHRVVDGDAACGFLEEVRKNLENFDFTKIQMRG